MQELVRKTREEHVLTWIPLTTCNNAAVTALIPGIGVCPKIPSVLWKALRAAFAFGDKLTGFLDGGSTTRPGPFSGLLVMEGWDPVMVVILAVVGSSALL